MQHLLKTIFLISHSILIIIFFIELIIGFIGNGFMALVHSMYWLKRKKMSLVNQILTALAISRILHLCLFFLTSVFSFSNPNLIKMSKIMQGIINVWIISNHFNIWLATCLSVLYFLKIATFSNSIFLYLKWRVEKVVTGTLVVSLVLLISNTLVINLYINICIKEHHRNTSCSFSSYYYANCHTHSLILHMIFLSIPFVLSLLAFFLLIFSLWTHQKKMQQHVLGSRDARTKAHFKALKIIIAFLLLYSIFILSVIVQIWRQEILKKNIFILLCKVANTAFPSFHSYILILGDMKLRRACLSVMWWQKLRSNYVESLDT